MLQKAQSVDNADIPDGMDIPTELSIRQERVKAIREAKAEIERRAAERHAEEQKVYETKVAERAKKEQDTGKKARGKTPQPPTSGPTEKDQVNLNDKESRIMPTSGLFPTGLQRSGRCGHGNHADCHDPRYPGSQ